MLSYVYIREGMLQLYFGCTTVLNIRVSGIAAHTRFCVLDTACYP